LKCKNEKNLYQKGKFLLWTFFLVFTYIYVVEQFVKDKLFIKTKFYQLKA